MLKITKTSIILLSFVFILSLAACSNDDKKADSLYESEKVALTLDKESIPAENWKSDGSHQKQITGKVLADNKPVVGAEVQISNKRKTKTDENGEFTAIIDANIIEKDRVHVASLDKATVEGKKLSDKTKESLLALEKDLVVSYPIAIDQVEVRSEDENLVDVHAHAVVEEDEEYPKFGVEKFPVKGTIKDADGNPVQGATVNLRRDGVEGFTMSEPSNENGEYIMYYIPEDDENHYLNVVVPNGDNTNTTYTLPEGKAFLFPDDSGISLDVVLPKEGTVIHDAPPTLVAKSGVQGALYKGVLIGLHATDYSITVPDRDGSFVVTLSKDEWSKNPNFYEINFNDFFGYEVNLGDTLKSDVIPEPAENEPDQIVPTKNN